MFALLVMLPSTPLTGPAPVTRQDMDRLASADGDGDGTITRVELEKARATAFTRLDQNNDGALDANDVPPRLRRMMAGRLAEGLSAFDTDHDGRVSRREFIHGPSAAFTTADADRDGRVTSAELSRARAVAY